MDSDSLKSIFAGLTLNGPSDAAGQSHHTPAASEFDTYGEESDSIVFWMAHTPVAPSPPPPPTPPIAPFPARRCGSPLSRSSATASPA